jgi:hypothetical protein
MYNIEGTGTEIIRCRVNVFMSEDERAGNAFEDGAKSGFLALNFAQNNTGEPAHKRQYR